MRGAGRLGAQCNASTSARSASSGGGKSGLNAHGNGAAHWLDGKIAAGRAPPLPPRARARRRRAFCLVDAVWLHRIAFLTSQDVHNDDSYTFFANDAAHTCLARAKKGPTRPVCASSPLDDCLSLPDFRLHTLGRKMQELDLSEHVDAARPSPLWPLASRLPGACLPRRCAALRCAAAFAAAFAAAVAAAAAVSPHSLLLSLPHTNCVPHMPIKTTQAPRSSSSTASCRRRRSRRCASSAAPRATT